jgi:hypothetical protein
MMLHAPLRVIPRQDLRLIARSRYDYVIWFGLFGSVASAYVPDAPTAHMPDDNHKWLWN